MALSMIIYPCMSFLPGLSPLRGSVRSSVRMSQVSAKAAWLAKQSPVPTGDVSGSGVPLTEDGQLMPKDIWVTSDADADAAALVTDQTVAVDTVLANIEGLVSELAAANPSDPPAGAAELAELLTDESVDAIVAPHLSLLMMPGYSDAARAALSKVRNVAQQAALLSLTQYMSGVYDEGEEGEGNTPQPAASAASPPPQPSNAPTPAPTAAGATVDAGGTIDPRAALDVALRTGAIDLDADDDETPRKGRAAVAAVEQRIHRARSVCTVAVDKVALTLTQAAFEQYMADQFDAAELDKRKAEARAKATAEHAPLAELDSASAAYTAAVSARREAEAAEDAAEAKLEAVMREVVQGSPGPLA
jgi:hypothetical protein